MIEHTHDRWGIVPSAPLAQPQRETQAKDLHSLLTGTQLISNSPETLLPAPRSRVN